MAANPTDAKQAPAYERTCAQCGGTCAAGLAACGHCGCPAHFKVTDLKKPEIAEQDQPSTVLPPGSGLFAMLVPEVIVALLLVLYAPVASLRLLADGDVLRGFGLLVIEVACLFGFVMAWRHTEKWLAYAVMWCFIVLFMLI